MSATGSHVSRPHTPESSAREHGTNVRIRKDLWGRLREEAEARDLGARVLLEKAITEFLERLIPVEEWDIGLTRKGGEK